MTWAELLQLSATLLNDSAQEEYDNVVLLPFLNMARNELQEVFELNEIPVVHETSAVINVPSGQAAVVFAPDPPIVGVDYLPSDLIEINRLWMSQEGQGNWVPVTKREYLTQDELNNNSEVGYFTVWAWMNQEVRLLSANADLDIKLDYIKYLFALLEEGDLDDDILLINVITTLQYRIAALAAEFIMENEGRAASLNANASSALDRSIGISTKGKQSIMTRRRPFRASWKHRGILV